ncbi:hypothetical protein CLIB1444_09S05182 [[Candida] jaroonii]|uniref:Uncharacterized protein n=1 Tax=[Candida] jaroonii TaxID=467808 RepID=A0ACA9YCD8_9ASCO|nr:hypothetical protein CLIB1444_09S05182 [[Candida] jaroonii]
MNEPELLKRLILEADSLTIRQGLFLLNENGTFKELSPDARECLEEVMKEMNWMASYKVYFSIPYSFTVNNNNESRTNSSAEDISKSDSQSTALPKGSTSKADNYSRDVIPQWTRKITNEWLDLKFGQVDKKFENIWSEWGVYIENNDMNNAPEGLKRIHQVKSSLPGNIVMTKGCPEDDVKDAFFSKIKSVLYEYLAVLNFSGGSRRTELLKPFKSRPDFSFNDTDGTDIRFFIEFKKHGLFNYVDENGIKDNHEMNTIMKQASKYMVSAGIDCCIISDVEVSILVQLDFETSEGKTEKILKAKGKIETIAFVPFKYYVFHPNDTVYTFQAILCSVLYDQKLRAGDPIQKQNVERLKALILKEDPELRVPRSGGSRGSSGSESQISHSTPPGSSMISYTPLRSIDEQDSSTENMDVDENPKTNEQKSWSQYKDRIFYFNKGDFEALQQGGYYLNTVLKLNRAAIDRVLPHLNIPPSVPYVILKVYDLNSSDIYTEYHDWEIGYEELKRFMEDKFNTEVECYIRTNAYNESHHKGECLRVPKMYEFGGGFIKEDGDFFSFGWYLILEYLEKDSNHKFSLEEAKNQVKLLGSMGIQHNDIHPRNVVVSHSRFNLIDFSEAHLDEIDIHEDLESLEYVWKKTLEHVWNKNVEQPQQLQSSFGAHEEVQNRRKVEQIKDMNYSGDSDKENRTKE